MNRKASLNYYSWLIAYIDSTYMDKVEDELDKYPMYEQIEAYIPTVKILTKTFKGKQTFEEVPLLFNYGFFKVPRKFAIHEKFLEDLKNNISCIYAWVKDPQKVIKKHPKLRLDKKSVYSDKDIMIATATSEEISRMVRDTFNHSAHAAEDLKQLQPGSVIILKGYPFENVQAEIVEIYEKKQEVKVKINIFDQVRDVMVAFDNVFYTIYHNKNFDDSITIKNSLDEMDKKKSLDKLTAKNYKDEG